jgi:hypothetical protein
MDRQLDLFADSGDVTLRNALAEALQAGDAAAAEQVARQLQAQYPGDAVLAPGTRLIEHLRSWPALQESSRLAAAEVADARRQLEGPLAAAARQVLGPQAANSWLAAQWCRLAGHAVGLAWNPATADEHAAGLLLRGRAWHQAIEAVARIESWRRIPGPLLWMVQARWHASGADAAWPLLAEALWISPDKAAALVPLLADRHLDRLADRFDAWLDAAAADAATAAHAAWSWLPAFALVDQPLLATPLETAVPLADHPPSQAARVVMTLLRLQRHGQHRELIEQRARLRALSPALFSTYMSTRQERGWGA